MSALKTACQASDDADLHLDEWLGRCHNGAAFGPCATRGFGYPGMTVGRSARAARSKFALT
jgi:hypothetical protein